MQRGVPRRLVKFRAACLSAAYVPVFVVFEGCWCGEEQITLRRGGYVSRSEAPVAQGFTLFQGGFN